MSLSDWYIVLRTYLQRNEGQTMAEYGVVLAVITIGAVGVFTLLAGGITNAINEVISHLPGADEAPPAE
jgi:Flp pilus assembly pilin Flp